MRETIGIMGAMDEEVQLLLQGMKQHETVKQTGITYVAGEWLGKQIVVCKSGVGKVNAAVTTQILIDRFQVNRVIFTGVAGAVHPDLNIGDMVISSVCVQHDMDVTPLGFERGVIPYQETSAFPAEASLIALAEEACKAQGAHYRIGKVLSGDQFIASKETVNMLYTEMDGACAEMEGAAVAQVCYMNRVPFVVLRSMSDKADGSAHVNFAEFTVESSQRSHRIVEHMLEHM
ncbi:5'-methylthioadenosine/adenosylhomocysteine nucleosidase [Paenibacillus silvae]|uniref:5'-methylthioadenosine/adenosylhomocysteine nucleosidase n=1 Tax=Paenibacillus silvae TaxID=1325358 RepID=UPI00259FF717|nr:5'-methylthioadenosine/adenosylhomocysteine nucleosidase [Paenibacillus silvae]MDM5276601.1 5'-methylthioadenosine/adenosylhomocysteine nucleosidase [Paenibacillus silvae]